jgi:putative transposase
MRLEPDRRHITVPVIGKLRSKENTRKLERLVAKGQARILSITLSHRGGRLVAAVQAIVAQQPRRPTEPDARCGVDLGIGSEWAVIAHHDDTIERVANSAPWKEVHPQQQRSLARQVSRRTVGSGAHRHAQTKRAALDRWVADWSSLTAGLGRPRPITAVVATGLTLSWATGCGGAPGVEGWWTATPMRR